MAEPIKEFLSVDDVMNYQNTYEPIKEACFTNYLTFLYHNLLLREKGAEENETTDFKKSFNQSKKNEGMSLNVFLQYLNIQEFIGERIYKYINKSKSNKLSKNDFVHGLNSIFFGDIEDLIKFIFFLCDFNDDGKIYKSDMKLILAYIPVESSEKQLEQIKHTNNIMNNYFNKLVKEYPEIVDAISQEITSTLFEEEIMQYETENRCDNNYNYNGCLLLFLKLISYIYHNKPFIVENVNAFLFNKNKTNLNKNYLNQTVQLKNKNNNEMSLSNTMRKSAKKNNIQRFDDDNDFTNSTKIKMPKIDLFQTKKEKIRENISPKVKNHKNCINNNNFQIKLSPLRPDISSRNKNHRSIHCSQFNNSTKENVSVTPRTSEEVPVTIISDLEINDENDLISDEVINNNLNETEVEFLEENCLKYSEEELTKCLKKYCAIIRGKEILFYSSKNKNDLCSIWNFNKSVIEVVEKQIDHGKYSYYIIKIIFYNGVTKTIYFEDQTIQKKFGNFLITRIDYKKFDDIYEVHEKLGEGHFAVVKRCTEKKTGQEYAVKIMNKKTMNQKDLPLVLREKNYMSLIKHPHIVSLITYFEDAEFLYFIMDYFKGGDLNKYILNSEKVTNENREKISAKIIKIIAQGIQYLNYFGIVHRDLKTQNILFGKKDEIKSIKIIDLGVAITLPYGVNSEDPIGTLEYIAPEIFARKPYSHKVDVWSLGILLYYLVTGGVFPFDDEKMDEGIIGKKIVFTHQEYPEKYFGDKSKSLERLIDKALEKQPEQRISISNFLKEEWLNKYSK